MKGVDDRLIPHLSLASFLDALIGRVQLAATDYIELVDSRTLKPCAMVDEMTIVALAVRIGKTRLIDNMIIGCGV